MTHYLIYIIDKEYRQIFKIRTLSISNPRAFRKQEFFKSIKQMLDLYYKKSWYGSRLCVLYSIIDVIETYLVIIFNYRVTYGMFTDVMKLSKVIPVVNSGSIWNSTNFRPISVLPTLSKALPLVCHYWKTFV